MFFYNTVVDPPPVRNRLVRRPAQSVRIAPGFTISPVFPHRNLLCQPVGESLQGDLGQVSPQPGSPRSRRSRRCGRCAFGDTPKGRAEQRVPHEESSPRPDANARDIAAGNAGPATFSGAPLAAPAGDARRGCPLGGRAVRPVPAARRGYAPAGRRGTALRA